MTKSIKIRPYRVFKKDGRHYVKINNKKVYIATKKRRGNKSVGAKQIVRVVVNNVMAQRKAYRRRTTKDVIPALLGKKGTTALQPAKGKSTLGKVDPTEVPPSDPPPEPPKEQAPTTDPLYVQKKHQQTIEDIQSLDADQYMRLEDMGYKPEQIRSVLDAFSESETGKI